MHKCHTKSSIRFFRNNRDVNDRALSCSAVISTSTTIVSMVAQNPVSYSIFTLIQTVITVTFTCTETEKTAIKSVSSSVSQAIVMVELEVTHVKEVFASRVKILISSPFNSFD